jgi:uncharacterized membrane protein YfcA
MHSMLYYAAFAVIGLVAGFASALLGIGGGVIIVPTLTFLLAAKFGAGDPATAPIKVAAATSLAYIVPIALVGALRSKAPVYWPFVFAAVPMGVVGAWLGAMVKYRIPAAQLKIVFAVVMFVAGVRLAHSGWRELQQDRGGAGGATPAAEAADAAETAEAAGPADQI